MVRINIEKKYLVLVGAIFVFLIGTGLVFGALGDTPAGASHLLSQIQGYFSGDANLDVSLGKLQERVTGTCDVGSSIREIADDGAVTCETDDIGSSLDCVKVSSPGATVCNTLAENFCVNTVTCPTDTFVTGGGCYSEANPSMPMIMGTSRPGLQTNLDAEGWYCLAGDYYATTLKAYAICCK